MYILYKSIVLLIVAAWIWASGCNVFAPKEAATFDSVVNQILKEDSLLVDELHGQTH